MRLLKFMVYRVQYFIKAYRYDIYHTSADYLENKCLKTLNSLCVGLIPHRLG